MSRSEDFASATLVGFVRAVCAQRGIALAPPSDTSGARIALDAKRDLLRQIARSHGLPCVFAIGREIRSAPFDPILHILLAAPVGTDVVARWQRMERYVHSRHRVRVEHRDTRSLTLAHVSETGEPPDPPEDLLVAGLLVGLLERRGCAEVALRLLQHDGAEIDPAAPFAGDAPQTARWRLVWRAEPPQRDGSPPAPLGAAQAIPRGLAARVITRLAADPTRDWSLADLAAEFRTSARTLQRRLAENGTTLSDAVEEARVREATRLLAETATPIGLVGLLAGYCDPPHFSRAFKKRTGLAPREYRALKAVSPDACTTAGPLPREDVALHVAVKSRHRK